MRWLPFQLNPDIPPEGIPRKEYFEKKFGKDAGPNFARVAATGKEVGIDFDFEAIETQANTINAHRLMHYATERGLADETAESLFSGYFTEGANLNDIDLLADLGERAGLERRELSAYLASSEDRAQTEAADQEARQAGIGGVPFFIFNRKVAVSGAHEPDTLLQAMNQALEKSPESA